MSVIQAWPSVLLSLEPRRKGLCLGPSEYQWTEEMSVEEMRVVRLDAEFACLLDDVLFEEFCNRCRQLGFQVQSVHSGFLSFHLRARATCWPCGQKSMVQVPCDGFKVSCYCMRSS